MWRHLESLQQIKGIPHTFLKIYLFVLLSGRIWCFLVTVENWEGQLHHSMVRIWVNCHIVWSFCAWFPFVFIQTYAFSLLSFIHSHWLESVISSPLSLLWNSVQSVTHFPPNSKSLWVVRKKRKIEDSKEMRIINILWFALVIKCIQTLEVYYCEVWKSRLTHLSSMATTISLSHIN